MDLIALVSPDNHLLMYYTHRTHLPPARQLVKIHPLDLSPSACTEFSEFLPMLQGCSVCLGEQSFKDADVLSEKINFSAPGCPKSTIFDTDDVDPLYFEVSIVSVPTDPPYMSKNGKMCYFYHFLRVPKKTYTQSTGLP